MSELVGEARVRIVPDTRDFRTDVERGVTRSVRQAEAALRSTNSEMAKFSRGTLVGTGALRQLGRAAAFASLSFVGGAGLVVTLKSASQAASALNEATARSEVVFGASAATIETWSRTSATALGLARDQAVQAAGGFGALLRPLGFTERSAADTGRALTQLAADLASFSDTSVPDALLAIRSGLVGEVEPLRRYGVVLSEAAVQQEALAQTGKQSVTELTAQEKVAARLALVFKQTSFAQGDFARTSGDLANQERTLAANLRDLQIVLGQALNPEIVNVVTRLNAWLGNTENQEEVQRQANKAVRDGIAILEGFGRGLDAVRQIVSPLIGLMGGLTNAVELLVTATVVGRIARFAGLLGGGQAAAAAGVAETASLAGGARAATSRVTALRLGLLRLGAIGAVALTIDLLINTGLGGRYSGRQGWVNLFHDLSAPGRLFREGTNRLFGFDFTQSIDPSWTTFFKELERVAAIGRLRALDQIENLRLDRTRPSTRPFDAISYPFRGAPVTDAQRRAIAESAVAGTGTDAEIQAIQAQIDAAEKARAFAQQRIDAGRGNVQRFADAVVDLNRQIRSGEDRVDAILQQRAQDAQDRRDKLRDAAEKARQAGIEAANSVIELLDVSRDSARREAEDEAAAAEDAARRRAERIDRLTRIPETLRLQLSIAEQRADSEGKLVPFLRRERIAVQKQIAELKRIGAGQEAILAARLQEETIKRRIRDISKQAQPFSLTDLFAFAGEQVATYGSDVAAGGRPLSAQDARASFGAGVLNHAGDRNITVIQNFVGERNAAQAIQEATQAARALK